MRRKTECFSPSKIAQSMNNIFAQSGTDKKTKKMAGTITRHLRLCNQNGQYPMRKGFDKMRAAASLLPSPHSCALRIQCAITLIFAACQAPESSYAASDMIRLSSGLDANDEKSYQ